jgi:hypothetical protein
MRGLARDYPPPYNCRLYCYHLDGCAKRPCELSEGEMR